MANDLHDVSLAELSRLIAARKLSPVELVEALIRRVEQHLRHEPANVFSFPRGGAPDAG